MDYRVQWYDEKYPSATCVEITTFLNEKCNEYPRTWIPIAVVGDNHTTQQPLCIRCLRRRILERACEREPHLVRPLMLYDTRVCNA